MVIENLTPAELAGQLSNPSGEAGIEVGLKMNAINGSLYADIEPYLALEVGQRVLEIGFANGRLIPQLMRLAQGLSWFGIDISGTMVAEAKAFNRTLIETARVVLREASVMAIPFADGSFDRALAVNTIYFWPDAGAGLREIHRVLKNGGRLALAAGTPRIGAQPEFVKHGFRFYDEDELRRMTMEAGFSRVEIVLHGDTMQELDGSGTRERETYIVIAEA
jgi:SAM-dependent methyltransferase